MVSWATAGDGDAPMTTDMPILRVAGISKAFSGRWAVSNVNFDIQRGSVTALIGPNGAGKTTLFDLITGHSRADEGKILFNQQSIVGLPPHRIARLGLARSFQFPRVFSGMTVLENLMVACPGQPGEHLASLFVAPRSVRDRETTGRAAAEEMLEKLRLEKKADHYAGTLSAGQKKLLNLAQVLMAEPSMVLLDEPMSGMNEGLRSTIFETIISVQGRSKTTFLFIEHDLEAVMTYAHHVLVMVEACVIASGTPEAVSSDPRVIDAYMGDLQFGLL